MDKEYIRKLSIDHANWFINWLRVVYNDAFRHGYKHGYDDCKKEFEIK